MNRVALLVSALYDIQDRSVEIRLRFSSRDSQVSTFALPYLANLSPSSGGYLLTQIPIIDGLRRSGDDEDLGFGRTYDEFEETEPGFDYDVSVRGGGR